MTKSAHPAAERYAVSLFEVASGYGLADPVEEQLLDWLKILNSSSKFRHFISSRQLNAGEKSKIMSDLIDNHNEFGFPADSKNMISVAISLAAAFGLMRDFILLLADHNRIGILPDIIECYIGLMREQRGDVVAEITTSVPFPVSEENRIIRSIKFYCGIPGQVILENRVKPEILGGISVKINSRLVDATLLTRFRNILFGLRNNAERNTEMENIVFSREYRVDMDEFISGMHDEMKLLIDESKDAIKQRIEKLWAD